MDGVGYKLYCRLWVFLYPLRYILKWVATKLKKGIKRMIGNGI